MNHVALATKVKYPHWHQYLRTKPKDTLLNEIKLLNDVATWDPPPNNLGRIGMFLLVSIPFSPLGGMIYLLCSYERHAGPQRQTECEYYEFIKQYKE